MFGYMETDFTFRSFCVLNVGKEKRQYKWSSWGKHSFKWTYWTRNIIIIYVFYASYISTQHGGTDRSHYLSTYKVYPKNTRLSPVQANLRAKATEPRLFAYQFATPVHLNDVNGWEAKQTR